MIFGRRQSLWGTGLTLGLAILVLFVLPLWIMNSGGSRSDARMLARATQALAHAQPLKLMLSEFHADQGRFPDTITDLGLSPEQEQALHEQGVVLAADGVIHARILGADGAPVASLSLSPRDPEVAGPVRWRCTSTARVVDQLAACQREAQGSP